MVKASQNPMAALQQMAQSDSRVQQVMSVIQQNGGDAKSTFYKMAQQKGVDPNTIIQQLQQMM